MQNINKPHGRNLYYHYNLIAQTITYVTSNQWKDIRLVHPQIKLTCPSKHCINIAQWKNNRYNRIKKNTRKCDEIFFTTAEKWNIQREWSKTLFRDRKFSPITYFSRWISSPWFVWRRMFLFTISVMSDSDWLKACEISDNNYQYFGHSICDVICSGDYLAGLLPYQSYRS